MFFFVFMKTNGWLLKGKSYFNTLARRQNDK